MAAPLADGHLAAALSVTVSPVIIVPTKIATFTVSPAVGPDTNVHLGERDRRRRCGEIRITCVFGGCRKSPYCGGNGGNKQQLSHSEPPPLLTHINNETDCLFVR